MNTFLLYILESTICISVFYLLFRLLMRKETSFAVNRATLLTIVIASVIVPLVQLPQLIQTPVHVELIPEFSENKIQIQNLPGSENATSFDVQQPVGEPTPATNELTIPLETLLRYFYLAGVLVALLLLLRNIVLIFMLSRKATVQQMDGYRLLIVDHEVPSFAFGRSVIISQTDYDAHGQAILAHEQAHIRLNHFVDLLLLELVRTIHWFNPAVYALIGDMKEIHEFQADEQTLHSGIDATQYQLLVIQKGVGPRRFALANSFNHCQIKKRITMMNKQKTSKAWRWKVATFLPLLALLLMAFGNRSEKVPPEQNLFSSEILTDQQDSLKQWTEADFKSIAGKEIEKLFFDGKKFVNVLMNSKSQLMIGEIKCQMADVPDRIRRFRDFSLAEDKSSFSKISINGKERMVATIPIIVRKDIAANTDDYQKLLNNIGNTILELRGKYANEIFGKSYQKLDMNQRNEIDKLVPFEIYLAAPKQVVKVSPPPPPSNLSKFQLYVLDGKIIEKSQMDKISPNDIQSINVIKGKSATDLFGERGKNGAVIITSKIIGADERNFRPIKNNTDDPQKNKDGVFVTAKVMPQFPGGPTALRKFIAVNVKYPPEAQNDKIQGKVFVSFVVNSKGKVEKVKIARGVRYDLDAEAIRVVSLLPDWTPGENNGEAVDVAYTIPIQFGLPSYESIPRKTNNTVFLVVDEMPQFPGGETKLMKFIADNIKYPEQAKTVKAQGEVIISFIVRSNGKVEDLKIIKGLHPELDAEAIRIANILPDWIPGKQDGKTVDVSCTVPIKFNLK